MKGNQRYIQDKLEHPNRTQERREASEGKQFPFAVVVGCSDSRVSPEIIFDQGVGDLFVVRVAGNVIGPIELESIQFAATALKSVLILVVGHENCSAVKAVVDGNTGELPAISLIIGPAIADEKNHGKNDLLTAAIKANAIHMKELLLNSGEIGALVREKKVEVAAAYYNLQTGAIELL